MTGSSRPITTLRIIARLNIGGPARHVVLLDRGLKQHGYETLLVHGALDDGEASFEHLAHDCGVEVLSIADLGRRISPISDLRAFSRLLKLMFERRPDIIHTHTAKAGTLGRLAALIFNSTRERPRRALVVHTFHGHVFSGYFGRGASLAIRLIERCLARATDRIITISPTQQDEITHRFGIAPLARTSVVPLGLDLSDLLGITPDSPNLREQLRIPNDAVVIGYVGRFAPIKNLQMLVAAFASAARDVSGLVLLLAGDGPVRETLAAEVQHLGLEARVRFIGWREDLVHLYATLDICAISSTNEGTPVAVIEAMAAGKPVVATAVGGVGDVVEDGRTGILVPSAAVDRFARALVELGGDSERRRAMGLAGRSDASTRFSADRLVRDVEQLYREGLSNKRNGQRARVRSASTNI